MGSREKLIALIENAKRAMKSENLSCNIARNGFVADFLIANGVTIQRWIPVTEKLPEENGIYQIFGYDEDWEQAKVWYGQFSYYDWFVYDIYGNRKRFDVTHWMPLTQPPKQVE